jgi:hypothetical protein
VGANSGEKHTAPPYNVTSENKQTSLKLCIQGKRVLASTMTINEHQYENTNKSPCKNKQEKVDIIILTVVPQGNI